MGLGVQTHPEGPGVSGTQCGVPRPEMPGCGVQPAAPSPEKALVLLSSLSSASRQESRSSWPQRPRGEDRLVALRQALLLNAAR